MSNSQQKAGGNGRDRKLLEEPRERKLSSLLKKHDELNLMMINSTNGGRNVMLVNEEMKKVDRQISHYKAAIFRQKLFAALAPMMSEACGFDQGAVEAALPFVISHKDAKLFMEMYHCCYDEMYSCEFSIPENLVKRFVDSRSPELLRLYKRIHKA